MLPYWDWTDPSPLLTDTFLGPTGAGGSQIVPRGYFAPTQARDRHEHDPAAPLVAGQPRWLEPAQRLRHRGGRSDAAMLAASTGCRRRTTSGRSSVRTTYRSFQRQLEGGRDEFGTLVPSGSQMHNGLHGYMRSATWADPAISPFDPVFYLHHCNIDRLWAMWQLDGHANVYPAAGAVPQHGPADPMYPWVGALPGYDNSANFTHRHARHNGDRNRAQPVDTLDYRAQYGYTYDTLAVIGIGLDRTGSMTGLTPDPMTGAGTVTKWEAAKRGVSAFLQDCETVQQSGAIYVTGGRQDVPVAACQRLHVGVPRPAATA